MPKGWTLADMPRQDGRRALITGANIGIGLSAARELARHGAAVVLASRSPEKAEAAAAQLRRDVPGAAVEVSPLDLASLASVHAFAQRELANPAPLDLLINNAGVYAPPKRLESTDGFELQFATNVLGHFALTGLLLPKLQHRATQVADSGSLVPGEQHAPRIVTIASVAHRRSRMHFDDLQFAHRYSPMQSYGQSKLANLLFAFELDRRLRAHGSTIRSVAAHPGLANTNLFKAPTASPFEQRLRTVVGHLLERLFNSADHGALPTLRAATASIPATAPDSTATDSTARPPASPSGAETALYFGPAGLFETRGRTVLPAKIAPQARDLADAARLWNVCEDLTNTRYLD